MPLPMPRFFARVIGGEKGPRRDVVLLNAGASLFVGGKAASVREGIERAAQADRFRRRHDEARGDDRGIEVGVHA